MPNPFEQFFSSFNPKQFAPAANLEVLFASGKRNMEAAISAGQTMTEGAQVVAQLNADIFQKHGEQALKLFKDLISDANNPEASIAKQADFFKNSVESNLTGAKKAIETSSKFNNEAFDKLNRRFQESLSEMNESVSPAAKKKANVA